MQATADIFGIPCKRAHTPETCALGASMEAAVGVGIYRDFPEVVECMTRSRGIFVPNPANQKLYNEIYERVFTRIYPSLEGVFTALNQISTHEMVKQQT